MVSLSAEVRGRLETEQKIAQVVRDLKGEPFLRAMRDSTLDVSRTAKRLAPVDQGRLRQSITPAVRLSGNNVIGVVGSNVTYAPFVELGTKPHWMPVGAIAGWARRHNMNPYAVARAIARRGTKPVRFLWRAYERHADRIQQRLEEAVEGIVRQ